MKQAVIVCALSISCGLWTYAAENKQAAVDQSIVGTWLIDPAHSGSLGAAELFVRKIGDATVAETSLVISTNAIVHRFKKPKGAHFEVYSQGGRSEEHTSELQSL